MKKIFLGSIALSTLALSIILFQLSCKKEATAQSSNCNETATVVVDITFPTGFTVSNDLSISDNRIALETNEINVAAGFSSYTYCRSLSDIGNLSKKVCTLKNVVPDNYYLDIVITNQNRTLYKKTTKKLVNITNGGQTYTFPILSTDFK